MPTRRVFLIRAIATGSLLPAPAMFAKASQPATPVSFEVPRHACDCHTHIFGDPARFPLSPERRYTPEIALPDEMSRLHRALGLERVVIVTPSIYGTDNSATLYGMKARGPTARGIAVIGDGTSEADLNALAKAGMCGIRLNSATAGTDDPALVARRFETAVERVKARNWHIQMYTNLAVISSLKNLVQNSPVPVVFDHFGGAQASLGTNQPGFDDLVELLQSGKAYVKISGAYIASAQAPDYPDVAPLAKALISANPDRVVWGTDWPHPNSQAGSRRPPAEVTPLREIDDGRLLNQLAVWAPEAGIRKKILVDNPARLYGF
ncbi:MAG: amidohydrolase family protein [Acidobacteriota bacterium]|nr:amidohydrolase family protein [Acidobacteriota bacterium]